VPSGRIAPSRSTFAMRDSGRFSHRISSLVLGECQVA
jgi:hypothetical protein